MKIKFINTIRFRNDEHFQFHTEVKDLITLITAEILKIPALFTEYLACYTAEDEAYKKIVKSAVTAEIEAADRRRDLTFRGLVASNKAAALNHFLPEFISAANRLKVVFDTYGNLSQKPLNEETAAIYNLLQELNNHCWEDVQIVRLEDWVSQLEADNGNFDNLVKLRNDENAAKTQLKMKETRAALDNVYESIVERINALIIVEGESVYVGFVNLLNTYIDKYSQIVAQREGRYAAQKEEGSE